jgi:diketogulonate reductase-like aldo/keto reductase
MQIGILPLTGTTNPHHMKADLDVELFSLSVDEVQQMEVIAL